MLLLPGNCKERLPIFTLKGITSSSGTEVFEQMLWKSAKAKTKFTFE